MRGALALRCYRGAKGCLRRVGDPYRRPLRALVWVGLGWLLIELAHLLLEDA